MLTLVILSASACAPNMSIPLALELETQRIDVEAQRTALEDNLCAIESSECGVLRRLDQSDDHHASATPRMPEKLPPVLDGLEVASWINSMRDKHELLPEQVVTLKVPSRITEEGIASLLIEDAAIAMGASSLSFNIPAYDVFLDGEHIARTDPIAAATDDRAALHLVDGATDRLRAALATGVANLVLAPMSGAQLELLVDDKGELLRPGGQATISLELQIGIPIAAF